VEKSKEEGKSSENNELNMWKDAECITPLDMPDGLNQTTIKLRYMSTDVPKREAEVFVTRPRFEALQTCDMEVNFQRLLNISTRRR
jgi:hypothetical protein